MIVAPVRGVGSLAGADEDAHVVWRSLDQVIGVGVVLSLVVLLGIAVVAYRGANDLVGFTDETIRTRAAQNAVERVVADLVDAETGQRGYLLTGDPIYLEPYDAALGEFDANLDTLRALLADMPAQRARVDAITALAAARLAVIAETLKLQRAGDAPAALGLVRTGQGKAVMDDIRRLAAEIIDEEQVLLVRRGQVVEANAQRVTLVIIGSSGAAFVIALSGGVTGYQARRRRRARVALARAHDELTASNDALRHEIAEREQAQDELRRSNRRLEGALAELRTTQDRMIQQERIGALGQLASGVAHDFNNALAPILGYSDLMLAEPDLLTDPASTREYLGIINTAAQDAAHVVSRLRDFYRRRAATDPLEPLDLPDLVAQAMSLTRPRWKDQAQAEGLTIDVRTELDAVPRVDGNASELRDVLTNLILNAVDAMPAGGTIAIRARHDGDDVCLEVADTGVGMSEDVRRRCLEPFFTTKGQRGSGLGLAMVHGTLERHGGTVGVESAPGRGTTVQLRLRAHRAPTRHLDAIDRALRAPLRVLLVDDEPTVRRLVAQFLQIDDHVVESASNGAEALAAFRAGRFDLVLTDRAMPDMGGDELAASVKALAPTTPVLMLTGFGELMNAADVRPAGVDLVIGKPITLAGLRAALATMMAGTRPN